MKEKIGFIGLGAMGGPMSRNLLKKGYRLTVYDIVGARMDPVVKEGAEAARSSKDVAEKSDVIITIVPSSPQVREVILGKEGVLEGVREGSIVIDMSTIDPVTTREISKIFSNKGVEMLDAPVARGVPAAKAGTLVIFVGGEKAVYEKCKDILSAMGTDIHYVGDSGAGEVVKIVNNFIVATTMCSLAEALVLGVKAGVKPDVLFKAISQGSANSFVLQNHVKNCVMKGKFEKEVFPVDYMIKDLDLALVTGAKYHVPLYFGSLATQAYERTRAAGYNDRYHPVVIRTLEELTGVEVRGDIEEST
ncbi:MAG: NAD-binding protein [Deltaproteobacteria bacterium]|nr:NAD-binding protein [Deltaproteobacteria bacterium]